MVERKESRDNTTTAYRQAATTPGRLYEGSGQICKNKIIVE